MHACMDVWMYAYIHTYIHIVNPSKLEHGFRRISERIQYTLP